MEAVADRATKEIAIQESDLTLTWRGGKGALLTAKIKPTRSIEMRYNQQLNRENIQNVQTIVLIKNGKALRLEVFSEKSTFVWASEVDILVPKFFIKTQIPKKEYDKLLGQDKEREKTSFQKKVSM
ncbi:type III secretion system protein PrgU [Enterococcus faecalis]|uniref:PrgU family protein n=1 Tax=Enterococcus faecalis TaxID=1351 RepID=UPI000CF0D221|nr:PrgU family protein [Enterococcus faecalis]EGO2662909.1 type III secretion system protein PrgU [Enterococcus faecalis]EGO8429038.1 type III secretion system protein PrgU [Enterococcus faecalis]EGO8568671.1 type III secretion system protein PrgU [Enterococcus faecalis]EGO8830812.1 type III secretion system protein PrgU [Enterococcus faecalis]EGO9352990.1 type III secretion system protein PrgU [Enterococcus faecalis]